MSLVSRVLERIGHLRPEPGGGDVRAPTTASPSLPPDDATADPDTDEVFSNAPTLPPGALTALPFTGAAAFTNEAAFPQDDFDPEMTQRSAERPTDGFGTYLESTVPKIERTQVGAAPEVTAVATSGRTPPDNVDRMTLSQLLAERGPLRTEALVALAGQRGASASLPEIFAAAGFTPSGGPLPAPERTWTIERAVAFVAESRHQHKTPAKTRFDLEHALLRDGASPGTIARDAAAKDEVLDQYETALTNAAARTDKALRVQADDLARRLLDLQAERDAVLTELSTVRRGVSQWADIKGAAERQWTDVLDVLAPFLSVDRGTTAPPAPARD